MKINFQHEKKKMEKYAKRYHINIMVANVKMTQQEN